MSEPEKLEAAVMTEALEGIMGRIEDAVKRLAPVAYDPSDPPDVICPYCSFECVAIESVKVLTMPNSVEVSSSGVRLLQGAPGGFGRGSEVQIRYRGECGHRWQIRQGFHKGSTYTWCEQLEKLPDGDESESLWRD